MKYMSLGTNLSKHCKLKFKIRYKVNDQNNTFILFLFILPNIIEYTNKPNLLCNQKAKIGQNSYVFECSIFAIPKLLI